MEWELNGSYLLCSDSPERCFCFYLYFFLLFLLLPLFFFFIFRLVLIFVAEIWFGRKLWCTIQVDDLVQVLEFIVLGGFDSLVVRFYKCSSRLMFF